MGAVTGIETTRDSPAASAIACSPRATGRAVA